MMGQESNEPRSQPSNEHRITRTRNRVPLSCVACRIRKLKCNREKPCQNCVVRGDAVAAACSYASAANPKSSGLKNVKSSPVDMRSRIDRLETLVRSLISQEDSSKGLGDPGAKHILEKNYGLLIDRLDPGDQGPFSSGSVESDETERTDETCIPAGGQKMSVDTRSTHWDAILHDITVIKDAWVDQNEVDREDTPHVTSTFRPGLLNGLSKPPNATTLLASLPPKTAADKLINRFFEVYNPAIPAQFLIHKPTFLKKYNEHWNGPSKTKIIWLGLLYSVLCFAMQSYVDNNEEPPEFGGTSKILADLYRTRAAQCIMAADVTRPSEYMIETLILYSLVEYIDQSDGDIGVWMIAGMIGRLALQQGYHRDPSQHPDMSPFQAEMRRRLWMIVSQHELIFSVQLGLPKMIRYAECDTATPRNLYEEELDEDMRELPPSRPMTDPTPISYQITKSRIMRAYGHVIEHLHILEEQPYDTVLRLDAKLIESRALVPPHLVFRPENEMHRETEGSIMEKYVLEHFYHKAICVLHRKYLNSFLADDTYAYSRRTCIASALDLLRQQASLHSGCQPGGRLRRIKWYRFSLIKHDFLLAAMVLCLALYNDKSPGGAEEMSQIGQITLNQRLEILDALQRGKQIWAEVSYDCADSKRALSILTVVLEKLGVNELQLETGKMDQFMEDVKRSNSVPGARWQGSKMGVPMHDNTFDAATERLMDCSWTPRAYANTLSNVNSMMSPLGPAYYGNDVIHDNLFSSGGIFNTFEPEMNLPANLDWAAWDLYINNNNRLDLPQDNTWANEPSF